MAADYYILALDYGDKRVGVAIAHAVARFPRPLLTLDNTDTLITDIKNLIPRENIGLVLVGLPRGMDGGYTEQTRIAEAFADRLKQSITVPVELADETLTSVDAEQALTGWGHVKGDIDAMAATLILERYLAGHPAPGVENAEA